MFRAMNSMGFFFDAVQILIAKMTEKTQDIKLISNVEYQFLNVSWYNNHIFNFVTA